TLFRSVDSTTGSVRIAAPQKVVMNGAGSYLKLEGGEIELGTSGGSAFKASMKELAGAGGTEARLQLPKPQALKGCGMQLASATQDGGASVPR
ncbi:MAG: DUF2345 domain-containing protein, partial [Aquabacterium sp.]